MRTRLILFTVVSSLIVAGSARGAMLPHRTLVGPAQGVQATLTGQTVTVRFTGASAAWGQRRAGDTAAVSCEAQPEPGLLFREDTATSLGSGLDTGFGDPPSSADVSLEDLGLTKLSASGTSVKAKVEDPAHADLCTVRTGFTSSADVAWAVLTPRGAVGLEELQRGLRMDDVIYAAAPRGTYRPAAAVVALGGGEVVALDDPNGTPPAGKIGYWSKGRAVSLVSASATGRRLLVQDLGGGMLRTNAFDALLAWTPAQAPKPAADASSSALYADATSDGGDEDDEDLSATDGLYAHLEGDAVVFRFTGKAAKVYRRIAGRRVTVSCLKAPARPLLGETPSFGPPAVTRVRVPAHGGVIRGRAPAGRRDLCTVETQGGADVALGVLSAEGRRYIIDFGAPLILLLDDRVPWTMAGANATRYPGVATIIAAHPGVVGLASPGSALGFGKIGVWTDAAQQALVAFGGTDGHRYVFADEGAGQVRTNLFTSLLGFVNALLSTGSTGLGG